MQKIKMGFFSLYETEIADSYVGTILITDNYGIPLEFKCTHSVKATPIQKALYGERLKPYIGIELCGVPLLKSITNTPAFLFVNSAILLPIRKKIDTPVILMSRAIAKVTEGVEETKPETNGRIFIENDYQTFEPIEISFHTEHAKDVAKSLEDIKAVFNNFDLFEPFERMKKSVEILGKSDSKFR